MFQLTKLRNELNFNKEIGGIINVLKDVASSEFYRLQRARKRLDQFGDYLQTFLRMVNIAEARHLFLEESSLPRALLLITSDIGFLGKLNVSIINSALEQCSGNEKLIIVGKQGVRYIEETGRNFTSFAGITDEVDHKEVETLTDFIAKGFLNKEFGRTVVIYTHFVSFALWRVENYQLLPCRFLFPESLRHEAKDKDEEERIAIEPTLDKVIEHLVTVWMGYILYGIFWESKLSEWSARVMHLEGSSSEIKRLDKKLRFKYFQLLHEVSDKNIREIFSSRLVMGRIR